MNLQNLSSLNDCQKAAVTDTEGAVLVFAGAGSGKTRVLTHRVAHLIEKGVPPYSILAITFTNKATNEMKERLAHMVSDSDDIWISTFHSFCAKILRINAVCLGYNPNFSIFNESGAERTVKKVLREKHLDEKKELGKIRNHISSAKNLGLNPDEYFDYIRLKSRDAKTISECYERYEELLKDNNAMDFDDLLIKTIELLKGCPEVREKYQRRFKYILIDEFQDTNAVQLDIVKLLSEYWGNIFAVGDDDQSIYGWRGADIANILNFEKIFKDVKVYNLTQNYRSTQRILDAANNVICHNNSRHDKQLFTNSDKGVNVAFKIGYNDHQEAEWVVENIAALKYHNGYKNSDFAILVRANSLTRIFEMKLKESGIAYKVYGGFKFFDRKEVQDILAYMRVLTNVRDNDALTRIINFPKRGIGDSTIETFEGYCADKGISLFDGIMDLSTVELPQSIKKKLEGFRTLLGDLISAKLSLNLYDFIKYLIEKLELESYYNSTQKEEDADRWGNTVELVNEIKDFIDRKPQATMEDFLQTVTLESDNGEEDGDKLVLSTMHSVKGLEFRVVFIAGCEEGIFPSSMSMNEENGIEEERRVMYVAITRAKERLFISCAQKRFRYNQEQGFIPSRFLYEAMGEEAEQKKLMNENRRGMEMGYSNIGYDNAFPTTPKKTSYLPPIKPVVHEEKPKVYNTDTDGFVAGAKVNHKKYGVGTIIVVDGAGMSKTATIAFKDLGIKKFALSNAPVELL